MALALCQKPGKCKKTVLHKVAHNTTQPYENRGNPLQYRLILAKIVTYFSRKGPVGNAFLGVRKRAIIVVKENLTEIKTSVLNRIFSVFMSVLALFCLCMGAFYWVRLIGVFSGSLWRFDLMPWNWRVLCSSLAVLYPVAACGVWIGSRWGIILWLGGAVTETVCMTLYSNYFSWNLWIPLLHIVFLVCYGFFSMVLFFNQPKRVQAVVEY